MNNDILDEATGDIPKPKLTGAQGKRDFPVKSLLHYPLSGTIYQELENM